MSLSSDGGLLAVGVAVLAAAWLLFRRASPAAADTSPDLTIPPIDRPLYSSRALSRPQQLIADKIVNESWLAGLDPAFMLALALTESSLHPTAKGDDGISLGLFQLQLATARDHQRDVTEDDLLRADTNIALAIAEMKRLMKIYPGFSFGDYAEAWTLGGRGRFVRGKRNPLKVQRMREAIDTLDLDLNLNEVAA
jgi:soluble lytic murein transglycosylase-like protein